MTKRGQEVKVNLVDVIRQAVPQVWGSDEREMLYNWLSRNTESQIVEIDLEAVRLEPRQLRKPNPQGEGETHQARHTNCEIHASIPPNRRACSCPRKHFERRRYTDIMKVARLV